jgi:hypothetical protein
MNHCRRRRKEDQDCGRNGMWATNRYPRKRQRTGALQNLAEHVASTNHAPASWSAAVPCRFSNVRWQAQIYFPKEIRDSLRRLLQGPHFGFLKLLWSLMVEFWIFGAIGQTLNLPPQPADAPSSTAFIRQITSLDFAEREREIYAQITAGNIPNFLRRLCPVEVTNVYADHTNRATFYATPDYLAVGSDEDYFLTPMTPNTAQRIADALDCSLPTRKMVNEIYFAAPLKLAPTPIPPSPAMTTVPVFSNHNATVREQRAERLKDYPPGTLTAGHQKDVVLANALSTSPGKVAIYGWHQTNGRPIQPLYLGHVASWVDYSQCIRLVLQTMVVNGRNRRLSEVLADPELSGLLSDEGTLSEPRYPTNLPAPLPVKAGTPPTQVTNQVQAGGFSGFQQTNSFNERIASFAFQPEVRVLINAPAQLSSGKPVELILYALPNGNTTEQTIGKALKPGEDWHYNIQHIGAQMRFLRELLPDRALVVAYLENSLKSWPAWRKKYGDKPISVLVTSLRKTFPTNDLRVVLTGHSGGGSFIFGWLNEVDAVPADVERIAFLDSNYAYDNALGHKEKLVRWLREAPEHYLCVLAYDDARALLDGKSFVSAAGGTWGRSHLMQSDLTEVFKFTVETNAGFETYSALDGRIQFFLKENPERKIFHTVQVERNGFIHAMLSGTTNENKGYKYFGERAYDKWIETQ